MGASQDLILNITTNQFNYNIFTAVTALLGSAPSGPANGRKVILSLSDGVIIGSTRQVGSADASALIPDFGWGTGWVVWIYVQTGTARIQGVGGNGGFGARNTTNDYFDSGGGGAGTIPGSSKSFDNFIDQTGQYGTSESGGSGGDGLALNFTGSSSAFTSTSGNLGGTAIEEYGTVLAIELRPALGATLQVWSGGGGGGGSKSTTPFSGSGGGPGSPGSASSNAAGTTLGAAGGGAGFVYGSIHGNPIPLEIGPGTIDRRGLIP